MSFVWSEDISLKAGLLAANMNEAQTNLDTLYTALELTRPGCGGGAGWTLFPITDEVDYILSTQPQELRNVADYAHENWCLVYDSGYKDGVDTTEETGYRNADLLGYDSTNEDSYRAGNNGTWCSSDLVGVDTSYYPGHDNFYDGIDT